MSAEYEMAFEAYKDFCATKPEQYSHEWYLEYRDFVTNPEWRRNMGLRPL
jgi:hypothetical protein